jgi:hypothetical protein
LGIAIGGVVSLVMLGVLIVLATRGENSVYHFYFAAMVGMWVLAPLLVANVVVTLIYLYRRVSARTYLWMWVPPLTVLLGAVMVSGLMDMRSKAQEDAFESAHPNVQEVHVNLSGRDLWLDPESAVNDSNGAAVMPAKQPERFIELTRYAKNFYGEDRMLAYEGGRLAADFRELTVYFGPPASTAPSKLPVVVAAPYPDVGLFVSKLSFRPLNNVSLLKHLYFHYADRVEVAPALSLSGSASMDLWGANLPVVDFHLANLAARPLARLEIDGQAVDLGEQAFQRESAEGGDCRSRNFEAHAINRLQGPLKVRWQFAQANPSWHEAQVNVPSFKSAQGPAGRVRSTSVDIYFQDDGSVVAERSQLIDRAAALLTVRSTGPAVALRQPPPCGMAADRFGDSVTRVQD